MSIGTEISRIAAAVDDIKTAITGKGVPVSGTVKVDGLPELIEQISTGVDTSDATALASDIKVGKTAYVNGKKITGTIATSNGKNVSGNPSFSTPASGNQIAISGSNTGDEIITPGAVLRVYTPASNFGDAAAEDVAEGKTFTSVNGLKVSGTYASLDTSDATASAGDIRYGRTAYVNGEKITGNLGSTSTNYYTKASDVATTVVGGVEYVDLLRTNSADLIYSKDSKIHTYADFGNFGNATAEDVVEGKTFTSTAGLMVTGTAEIPVSEEVTLASGFTNAYSASTVFKNILSEKNKSFGVFVYKGTPSVSGQVVKYCVGTDTDTVVCAAYSGGEYIISTSVSSYVRIVGNVGDVYQLIETIDA